MEHLTEEELARIEAEHVHSDYTGVFGLDTNGVCAKSDFPWPCDVARLLNYFRPELGLPEVSSDQR